MSWVQVAAAVDRVFFVTFSLVIVVCTALFLPYIVVNGGSYNTPSSPTFLGCFNMTGSWDTDLDDNY